MWRLAIAAALLLTLALAGAADGKCRVCVDAMSATKVDGGTQLTFSVFTDGSFALPDTAKAVVMQVDGDRSKCIDVALVKGDAQGGRAIYSAVFTPFAGYINESFTGRFEVAGEIFEFAATMDGKPGRVQLVASAPAGSAAAPAVITAAPAPSAQPAVSAQRGEPAVAGAADANVNPVALLGLIVVIATLAGAYLDRRRSLARAAAA